MCFNISKRGFKKIHPDSYDPSHSVGYTHDTRTQYTLLQKIRYNELGYIEQVISRSL